MEEIKKKLKEYMREGDMDGLVEYVNGLEVEGGDFETKKEIIKALIFMRLFGGK